LYVGCGGRSYNESVHLVQLTHNLAITFKKWRYCAALFNLEIQPINLRQLQSNYKLIKSLIEIKLIIIINI
jgi:hypothetical protein